MRIQPPKTKATYFKTGSKSFEKYILGHYICFMHGGKELASEFFKNLLYSAKNRRKILEDFLTMWPLEYQPYVQEIYLKKFKEFFVSEIVETASKAKLFGKWEHDGVD